MANLERISYASLHVIPDTQQLLLHRMYEDSDLDGASIAERTVDFLNQEAPDTFIAILANDSVTPACCTQKMHYGCDYYAPDWYTVLVNLAVWESHKEAVLAADRAWKAAHRCKQEEQ